MDDDADMADRIRQRLEIVDAVRAVLDRREELLEIIEMAPDGEAATRAITARFGLSEIQAFAVLDLQVRRFCQAERQKISDEARELHRELDRS